MAWLDGDALRALPAGTAVVVETVGAHTRATGRILAHTTDTTELDTTRGEVAVKSSHVKRARVIAALYEPGDPVLKRGVPSSVWRGGVVRVEGGDVLVEQLGGAFVWLLEGDLEPADARDAGAPPSRRGPVPARAG